MRGVQPVEVLPFRPSVKWMNQWQLEPTEFLERYLPLAVWSALKIVCKNEPIHYPIGAQKILQKARQSFNCSQCNTTWYSSESTCLVDYELKWKTEAKQEIIIRFQPTVYGEKCPRCPPRCRKGFIKGHITNKVLVGFINRFVKQLALKTKNNINTSPPKFVRVDFNPKAHR